MTTNPFDYVNSILTTKKDLIVDEQGEKDYNPFLANRALSYYPEAIFYAQEMNFYNSLDKKLQYHYLINTLRPMKRQFVKWAKKKDDKDIAIIQEYFGYNDQQAKAALSILSKVQLNIIKEKLEKGGLK